MSTHHYRGVVPLSPPLVATSTSVTAPPLASDSKSLTAPPGLCSVTRSIATVPQLTDPVSGNAGLSYQTNVGIFSRIPSKGEISEISFSGIITHFKLVKPARGDMSIMLLFLRVKRINPVNPARGRYI